MPMSKFSHQSGMIFWAFHATNKNKLITHKIAMRTKRSDIMSAANKIFTPTENDIMAIPCDNLN